MIAIGNAARRVQNRLMAKMDAIEIADGDAPAAQIGRQMLETFDALCQRSTPFRRACS